METAEGQPPVRRPWAERLAWAFAWGAVLGGVVFAVGFGGGLGTYRGSNLAPILGFLLAPPAFLAGPVTLSRKKVAGELTEIVLRRHGAGIELAGPSLIRI